jgi:hypothetical protein
MVKLVQLGTYWASSFMVSSTLSCISCLVFFTCWPFQDRGSLLSCSWLDFCPCRRLVGLGSLQLHDTRFYNIAYIEAYNIFLLLICPIYCRSAPSTTNLVRIFVPCIYLLADLGSCNILLCFWHKRRRSKHTFICSLRLLCPNSWCVIIS